MKIACLLAALMAMILSGCEQKRSVEPNETDVSFDKDLESFVQRTTTGGYVITGPGQEITIVDVTNIKLLYANYKSSQKLQTAIEEFNISSTVLAKKMLYLTILMAFLTAIQGAKPIWRFLVFMRVKKLELGSKLHATHCQDSKENKTDGETMKSEG